MRQHRTGQKQMGLLRDQCAELRKGLLQYCCNLVWMKNGGRIPRNVTDIPCERRFGIPFIGPVIPFGAMVEYYSISVKDLSRLHQFGPKVLPSVFLGYVLSAGGIWKGDIMVADIEALEKMDASELHARRVNAKEVLTPMKVENFIFPIADGTVKISGEYQDLRTSTLIRDSPDRGEEQDHLRGESDGSSSTARQDSSWYDGEAKNGFGSISGDFIYRHHVELRVKLHVPTEESFPIPLKYIDVIRTTDTTSDVMLEKVLAITEILMDIVNCQTRGLVSQDSLV